MSNLEPITLSHELTFGKSPNPRLLGIIMLTTWSVETKGTVLSDLISNKEKIFDMNLVYLERGDIVWTNKSNFCLISRFGYILN